MMRMMAMFSAASIIFPPGRQSWRRWRPSWTGSWRELWRVFSSRLILQIFCHKSHMWKVSLLQKGKKNKNFVTSEHHSCTYFERQTSHSWYLAVLSLKDKLSIAVLSLIDKLVIAVISLKDKWMFPWLMEGFNISLKGNDKPLIVHWPVWVLMCVVRWSDRLNDLIHIRHWNGFWPANIYHQSSAVAV